MKELAIKNMSDELATLVRTGAMTGSFIAGGAARDLFEGKPPRDVDFFQSNDDPTLFKLLVVNLTDIGYTTQFENPMLVRLVKEGAITVDAVRPRKAQYLQTYGAYSEVVSNFDFTVCSAVIKQDASAILAHDDFETDLAAKRLRIIHIVCPINQVKRIAKYAAKGFTIGAVEILKMFTAWTERGAHAELLTELLTLVESGQELTAEQGALLNTAMYVD